MKKIIYILSIVFSLTALISCEKTSEDTSTITYYVTFEINGDATTLVPVGDSYTELGVVAMEGETDVTSSVIRKGEVNSEEIGVYTISYSATNIEGYSSSIVRTVVVYDPEITTDISGNYMVADGTNRLTILTGARIAYDGYPVSIKYMGPGVFYVSDFFGGFYEKRAGYGEICAMTGYFKLKADNSLELLSSFVRGWGDSLDDFENATFDPETNTIHYETGYAGSMVFILNLKK